MNTKNKIEVCFSPALFQYYKNSKAIVVVIDTLRATSAICNAFQNGVEKIIPVKTVEEAREYKKKGYIVAAERDGYVLDFADFGNSPFNFTEERVKGKTIVYSTTNGTQAIQMAASCYMVAIGSFLNLSTLCNWLINEGKDVLLLCAGWKNKFNLEDTVLAGAITEKLIAENNYSTICDSAIAALDIWSLAKPDILGYVDNAAQRTRLREKGLDDVLEFCHTPDSANVIPVLENDLLVEIGKRCIK